MRTIVLGDSVAWGQGLLPDEKYSALVVEALAPGSECIMLAHSGATIGTGATISEPPIDGEVPTSYPTIIQQCQSFTDAPETVDLVLVNGGINDVDITTILDPLTDSDDLREMITQYCYEDMETLLDAVVGKFTSPTVNIVVTSYYPILSKASDPLRLPAFLGMRGVAVAAVLTDLSDIVLGKVIANCTLFAETSSTMLKQAVAETDGSNPAGKGHLRYAEPAFGPQNAALAPDSWLWGIDEDPELSPEDPMREARHTACDLYEPDLLQRQTCYRASAGHPNIEGAQQFAAAILAALKP